MTDQCQKMSIPWTKFKLFLILIVNFFIITKHVQFKINDKRTKCTIVYLFNNDNLSIFY